MKNLTTSTILILVTSVILSFVLGRYSVTMNETKTPQTKSTKDVLTEKGIGTDTDAKLKLEEKKKENEIAAQKLAEEEKKKAEALAKAAEEEKKKQAIVSRGQLNRTKMGISDDKIGKVLSAIAQNLENKRLVYDSKLMQDCSGIFHQMKDSLQKRLPALAASGGAYQYPSSASVRNTRQIADWFYKNNNLLIVEDALAARNSIRPGTVLFYGKSNRVFKDITIDMLTDRENNYTSNGAIMHIAVVTSVTPDKEGNVKDYTIMHGRNARNHASRTGSKAVQSTRTPNLPPFGNWSQQLVAIANIATPSS